MKTQNLSICVFVLLTICLVHGNKVASHSLPHPHPHPSFCEFDTIKIRGFPGTFQRNCNPFRSVCDEACRRKFGDSVFGRLPGEYGVGIVCSCFTACLVN
ncbi:unnamed protein product [Linum tenue]|uniref:Uncharacterized protein n=1 Tax=Linum tenue TaxID=586396 RepID=A0AAV0K4W5_9ROSI|nr:unnamed protein product [Linum tenue]CAI0417143.1 unnamed protein product [Linum tenue]